MSGLMLRKSAIQKPRWYTKMIFIASHQADK